MEGVSARWQALWRQECVLFLEPCLRGASNVKVRVATVSRDVCFGFLFCCVRRDRCVGVKVLCMVCCPWSFEFLSFLLRLNANVCVRARYVQLR